MCGNSLLEDWLNGSKWKSAHEPQRSSLKRYERRYFIGEFLSSIEDSAISADSNDVIYDFLMQGYLELMRDILRMPRCHLLQCFRVIEIKVSPGMLGQRLGRHFDQSKHLLLFVNAAHHQHCNRIIILHPKLKVMNLIILNY